MFIAVKNVTKNAIHVIILLMKPLLLYQKQPDGNIGLEGIPHTLQIMLYIWLIVQNVENKEQVLLSLGNIAYQIIKVTLNNPSIIAK